MRILITGGGGASNSALFELLREKYEPHFADVDIDSRHPAIPVENFHRIEAANSENFIQSLRELEDKYKFDLIIPAVDEELTLIGSTKDIKSDVLLPNSSFVVRNLNKFESNKFLQSKSISVPKTLLNTSKLSSIEKDIGFPCILKPIFGRGSRGVTRVECPEHLRISAKYSGYENKELIVQELLVGQEYTVTISADKNGNVRAIIPARVENKKGITIEAVLESNDLIEDYCNAIHHLDNPSGLYNVQLILTEDGNPYCFEINPRISTTSCFSLVAGIDFIHNYYDDYCGQGLQKFTDGIRLKRFWLNEFS